MTDSTDPVASTPPESEQELLTILDSRKSHECPRFKVNETIYQIGKQEPRKTYKIELSGDLLVIIPRFDQKILLIKDWQIPNPTPAWGFPTGVIPLGKPIAEIAQELLQRTTGTIAQRFVYLDQFVISKYIENVAHVMAADGVHRVKNASVNFSDKVRLFSEKEVGSLLVKRELDDGLALASYVYYATSDYFVEAHGYGQPSNASNNAGAPAK